MTTRVCYHWMASAAEAAHDGLHLVFGQKPEAWLRSETLDHFLHGLVHGGVKHLGGVVSVEGELGWKEDGPDNAEYSYEEGHQKREGRYHRKFYSSYPECRPSE